MNDNKRRVETSYYEDGTPSSEVTYVGEHIHGVTRTWHANGSIESEVPMVFSKRHGVSRHWDDSGKLLGMNAFENGTGTFRNWYSNGRIQSEMTVVNGVPEGWQRCWDETGELLSETFFSKGKILKRKSAIENAEAETLSLGFVGSVATVDLTKALEGDDCVDAEELLRDTSKELRLGENCAHDEAQEFLKTLYSKGARKVLAVVTDCEDDESIVVGALSVELPSNDAMRAHIFSMKADVESILGFDNEEDVGQEIVLIHF